MLRNGEQLLLAVVIPVIVLSAGSPAPTHVDLGLSQRPVDVFTPGVLALAVMSTAFTSLAIATGFERRYGVIKRLGPRRSPRSGLLLGKVGALLAVEALQIVVISRGRVRAGLAARTRRCRRRSLAVLAGHGRVRRRSACSSPASCAPRPRWPRRT